MYQLAKCDVNVRYAEYGIDKGDKSLRHKQNNKSKTELTNTIDIYSADNTRITRDYYDSRFIDRYKKSRDFKQTKIIPRDYKEIDYYERKEKARYERKDYDVTSDCRQI